jgi:hypothetical protein
MAVPPFFPCIPVIQCGKLAGGNAEAAFDPPLQQHELQEVFENCLLGRQLPVVRFGEGVSGYLARFQPLADQDRPPAGKRRCPAQQHQTFPCRPVFL